MMSSSNTQTTHKRPPIQKLGTIGCRNIVETTPILFNGALYRFEVVRRKSFTSDTVCASWRDIPDLPCLRFVHVETGTETPLFAEGHTFGFPYAVDGRMYVVTCEGKDWGSDRLVFFRSTDLTHWERYTDVHLPGWRIYNMNMARMGDIYTLLIEIDAPAEECGCPFTFRFLTSPDLVHWTLTPSTCVFQKNRYAGGPSLYAFDGDPYYYVGYLEAYPGRRYANCLARSRDLCTWEYSPFNPILSPNDAEDKVIHNPHLTEKDRLRIRSAVNVNNSDMELCDYQGHTVIYYSWGDQRGNEFLAEARYDGPLHELLRSCFENPSDATT